MPDEAPLNIDPNRPWYAFQAAADQSRKAKVLIYDAIGGWFGVQTSQFVKELNALDVDEIELHLNSPGGAAFDGIAIHNALRQHQAKVTVIVDGLAASAASAVAMGGDEIVMAHGSMLMIHDTSMIAWGNAGDLRKVADVLDKLSDNYAALYARRAGGTAADWREAMLAETWYSAEEAVDAGLADRTESDTEADAEAMAVHLATVRAMSTFAQSAAGHDVSAQPVPGTWAAHLNGVTSISLSAAASAASQTPVSSEPGNKNRKEEARMDEFLTALRTRLGLNAEASPEEILAAIDSSGRNTEPPAGTVLVEKGVFEAMQADAAAGREAREQQIKDRRDGIITKALAEGRITAVTSTDFRAALDKDEDGISKILASMPANGAVNVTEAGEGKGDPEASADDAFYGRVFPTTDTTEEV